ncbi:uncharacterized protein F4807DRAFT_284217 [Annulohypoxylon truncatum]|uniref:uncharacterized protein n=1 Tax=Annulohypoxylon truncatum TaxID=327061 RepID=UPI0020083D2D|nr:uncharacterized protein F4807DRAFT_284217 [Annulohypoxylon truncatum]KAI1205401.1 hypothetical protein F4807DRAFT_284217 [Annulohypoxylon truncatum]
MGSWLRGAAISSSCYLLFTLLAPSTWAPPSCLLLRSWNLFVATEAKTETRVRAAAAVLAWRRRDGAHDGFEILSVTVIAGLVLVWSGDKGPRRGGQATGREGMGWDVGKTGASLFVLRIAGNRIREDSRSGGDTYRLSDVR